MLNIKNFNPNPLNVHGLRVLGHCPPHFFVVDFDLTTAPKKVSDWIYENLSGRYYFGEVVGNNTAGSGLTMQKRAAFEIHSEASYFALMLPDLNKF